MFLHLKLFLFGLFIHLTLIYAVFDIFYVSPIIKNARSHTISSSEGPSKRIVVFSADGLRSRTFFDHPDRSPFLHGLIRGGKAAYGISRSHVPTESRPGHVAIFAGFFEDVSAVAKGWKQNPIKFDSIFNQSSRTWLFGSPDIVLPFGEELNHAKVFYYSADEERFFDADASGLDRWVFDKVKEVFSNNTLDDMDNLEKSKSLFFLHLLGIDSNGHGHKPHSEQYLNNIQIVDEGIQQMVQLFESRFKDNRTSYLFTSDHGMSDYGSHGAGTDDEILTPFIAWGAGIRPLNSIQTVNQIDLAPLQAAVLNVPIPTNNFGILPLNLLNASSKYKFQAASANLKQMVEQYGIKRNEKFFNSLPFMFKDYPGFKASALNRVEENLVSLAAKKRYDMAALKCIEWIPNVRNGFLYFHRYHRSTLGMAISFVFVFWNAFLYIVFSRSKTHSTSISTPNFWCPGRVLCVLMGLEFLLCFYQRWPAMHLIYVVLPIYLLALIINALNLTRNSSIDLLTFWRRTGPALIGYIVGLGILMFVLISAFFNRGVVSAVLIFMSPLPQLSGIIKRNTHWSKIWSTSCLLLAVFPQCQPVGQTPLPGLAIISPILWSSLLYFYKIRYSRSSTLLFDYFIVANVITSLLMAFSNFYWTAPSTVKLFAWFSITLNLTVPLLADVYLCDRIVLWMSAINCPYSLMSIAYESIFYLIFCVLLFAYIQLEHSDLGTQKLLDLKHTTKKSEPEVFGPFGLDEWRRAITLLALIEIAFFGTGNLSSLNSFNPSFLRNFMSTFSPFTMAILLITKIVMPFFVLACAFSLVLQADKRQHSPKRVSVLLFIISDSMAMIFYHFLKDEGSWLEIGISISNYVISMATAVIFFVLFHFSDKIFVFKLLNLFDLRLLDENKAL